MKNEAIPKVRFKGFNDKWILKKLGTIAFITKLAGFEFTKYVNYSNKGHIVALRGVNIVNNSIDLNNVKYIDNSNFSKLTRSKLIKGDIVFTYVGTLGKSALIDCNNKYYLAPNVALIRHQENISPNFIHQLISTRDYYRKVIYPFVNTSSQPALSMQSIRQFSIYIPSLLEQRQIGTFFATLDQLIQLQQKKVDLLKRLKKAYLQKLFPLKDESVPRIRFKGFHDRWVPIKLKDMLKLIVDNRGKTPPHTHTKTSHPILEVASLGEYTPKYSTVTKYVTNQTYNTWFRKYLRDNDILFSTVGDTGLTTIVNNNNSIIAQNIIGLRFNKYINSDFALNMFNNYENWKRAKRIEMGAIQPSIKVTQLVKMHYLVPSLPEQVYIGTFFKEVSKDIAIQRNKLKNIKKLKKSYLQKMFC